MNKWTAAQQSAIDASQGQGNILVGAAAGSGKTAVLVERIITKLLNGETDIDRLLVVTFTDAAAGEMKEKITDRLQKAVDEEKDKSVEERLRKQLKLIGGADITTIDAFCLRVVKNNFHVLGIDPNFFISDSAEGELLRDDVLDALFNDLYIEGNDRFLELVEKYASNRDDRALKRLVVTIYEFVQSFAEPIKWLDEKAEVYEEDMAHGAWAKRHIINDGCNKSGKAYNEEFTEIAVDMIKTAVGDGADTEAYLNSGSEEMIKYWGALWTGIWECINISAEFAAVSDWDSAHELYMKYIADKKGMDSLTPSKAPKKKEALDEDWKAYCERRNGFKKKLKAEMKKLVKYSAEEFNEEVHSVELAKTAHDIVWLVKEFDERYMAKKESRNMKEFSDIEHLTYKLFCENEVIRNEYRDKYDEILIDEYQDTNGLQDAIFTKISLDNKNIFMVGDLKQSIYGFRGGDPTIFKWKSREYRQSASDGRNITLSQNFRSRQEILKSVNDIFCCIMSEEAGDVNYEGDELIVRDAEREAYPESVCDNTSELSLISIIGGDSDEDLLEGSGSVSEKAEAAYVAGRIHELVESKYRIYDKNLGRSRNIRYNDITILAKSVKYTSDVFINALSAYGIPAFVDLENYFERREIRLMLTLISLINNHLQDIELLSVMRSPIGGFSDNELAVIRLHEKNTQYFYYALKSYADSGADAVLREKCERFVANLKRWRGYVKQKSVANLIWTIYSETGFYDFMGVIEGGEEAQANLKLLYERAKKYEQSGFKGLFNFLRYIDKLQNRRDDLSGAKLIGENCDVVRIMTIHKSKGLEFPVVFLTGMGKRIKGKSPDESRVLLHKDLGFGLKYADAVNSYYKDNPMKNLVAAANSDELTAEAMRLMYVAMTRAKEKLIVTGVKKHMSDESRANKYDEWNNAVGADGKMTPANALKATLYMDWLYPAALKSDNWIITDIGIDDVTAQKEEEQAFEKQTEKLTDELIEAVGKILDFSYKYPKSGYIPSKTSVSALKRLYIADDEEIMEGKVNEYDLPSLSGMPKFMRQSALGSEIGTAHHQLMAFLDFDGFVKADNKLEFVKSEIERLIAAGQIDADAVNDKMAERCVGFMESDLAKRMMASGKIFREKSFQVDIPAKLYDESLGSVYDSETVILQGVIDCFFEEEDGVVLIDYKTDRVNTVEEIVEKYRLQLDLYAEAIEKITKKSVKEKYLYLFSLQSVVKL